MHALVFGQFTAEILQLPNNPLARISDVLRFEVIEIWHNDTAEFFRSLETDLIRP